MKIFKISARLQLINIIFTIQMNALIPQNNQKFARFWYKIRFVFGKDFKFWSKKTVTNFILLHCTFNKHNCYLASYHILLCLSLIGGWIWCAKWFRSVMGCQKCIENTKERVWSKVWNLWQVVKIRIFLVFHRFWFPGARTMYFSFRFDVL